MKREVGKSNMLFCYYHREYYCFLRLCASNAKPYGILEGQMSTLYKREKAGRYIKFKFYFGCMQSIADNFFVHLILYMLQTLQFMSVKQKLYYNNCIFIYMMLNNTLPVSRKNKIKIVGSKDQRQTR